MTLGAVEGACSPDVPAPYSSVQSFSSVKLPDLDYSTQECITLSSPDQVSSLLASADREVVHEKPSKKRRHVSL